jgi:O-antigen/teichoic acid export membrane protein
MFVQPLNFVLSPTLAKFYDNGKINEVKRLLGFSIKMFLMFALPLVVGFTILSRPMLLVIASKEVSDNGAFLVPVITLGMLLYGFGTIYGQIISLVKKTHIAGVIWGGAAFVNIVLNFLLIPPFGIMGPAISTLSTFGFATLVIVVYTKRFIVIPIDWQFVFKSIVAAFGMGAVIYLLLLYIPYTPIAAIILIVLSTGIYLVSGIGIYLPHTLIETLLLIVIGVGVYFSLMIALRALGKQEKEFFANLLIKKT